jgi:hypothetical protein
MLSIIALAIVSYDGARLSKQATKYRLTIEVLHLETIYRIGLRYINRVDREVERERP